MFLQLAEGVDDETWMHHLRRGDYSNWFEQVIKDHELAEAANKIEQDRNQTPAESKKKIKEAVDGRYTVAM